MDIIWSLFHVNSALQIMSPLYLVTLSLLCKNNYIFHDLPSKILFQKYYNKTLHTHTFESAHFVKFTAYTSTVIALL